MARKLTYEELKRRLKELEEEAAERREEKRALRESEEKFKSLAEQSPNMIFINRKERVVYANKRCADPSLT